MEWRLLTTVLAFGWSACTAYESDARPGPGPDGASGSIGSGAITASGGMGADGGTAGDASVGSGGAGGSIGSSSGGSGGDSGAGTAGVLGSGDNDASEAGGATDGSGETGGPDSGDAGSCMTVGCPDSAPVCSADACRKIKQIAAGFNHTCALIEDGTVRCWAVNALEELGIGTRDPLPTPGPPVVGVTDAVQLAVGMRHSCALTSVGSVWCWGQNDKGELGVPPQSPGLPVLVPNLDGDVVEVDCHGFPGQSVDSGGHTCVRMRSGRFTAGATTLMASSGTAHAFRA